MQTIDTYQQNAYFRVLIQGPPGSGKSSIAAQFPNVYFADCDLNLAGVLRWLKRTNKPLPIGYDTIDRKEDGTLVEEKLRFERLVYCLQQACANPAIDTIVLDSGTKIGDYITAHTLFKQNKSAMEITSWGFYLGYWKSLIGGLCSQPKHLVFNVHEKVEKDEIDQALKYFLNIPGQFGGIAGSLFTDVWRAEVVKGAGFGANAEYKYVIRTMPDHKFQLKNSLGLPPVMEFDWNKIQEKLEEK